MNGVLDARRAYYEAREIMVIAIWLVWVSSLIGPNLPAQQGVPVYKSPIEYENRNQIDPDRFQFRELSGKVIIQLESRSEELEPIPGACLGLFTEQKHKLVADSVADDKGQFKFDRIQSGRYRLVVRDPQNVFCVANVPIQIVKWPGRAKSKDRQIVIHMVAARIDVCSYADYK